MDVHPFTPDLHSLQKVPIVDATIDYDCFYTMSSYIIVGRNILNVPSIEMNSIPPFILREAGVVLNNVSKIHIKHPSVEDHSLHFEVVDV